MELRPDRNLLDRNFEGYTLSLEKIPTREVALSGGVHRVRPGPDHYTYRHSRLFGAHEHLVVDERSDDVYYIDAARNVVKVWNGARLWKVPPERSGGYNMSLKLPCESHAVLADGAGKLYVLERTPDAWTPVFEEDFATPFILVDCAYDSDSRTLKCLRFQVTHDGDKHFSDVWWTAIQMIDGQFTLERVKRLRSKGELYYAALEQGDDYVCTASDSSFSDEAKGDEAKYTWSQDEESVVLRMRVRRSDVKVTLEPKEMMIRAGGETLLSGKLYAKVRTTASNWHSVGDTLEVLLRKDDVGVRWTEVILGNEEGECVFDEAFVEQVHQRLAHLCNEEEVISANSSILNTSAMEECDFPTTSDGLIERISVETCRAVDTVHLGFQSVLFAKKLAAADAPPALAVHHNEDVCMFRPSATDDGWRLEHVGTLLAFGYVQASKQRRKYLTCAPDLGYSVVCESERHLFVYRQAKAVTGGELKHRFTGRKVRSVAQQQVIELTTDEVLGVHADNSRLLVMTGKCLYVLSM